MNTRTEGRLISVNLCVNDENGAFTGQCVRADITVCWDVLGDVLIDIEGIIRCELKTKKGELYMGGRVFEIEDYRPYVGNLAWDAAIMTIAEAADLFEFLRARGWALIESAEGVYDAYEAGAMLSGQFAETLAKWGRFDV